MKNKRFKSILRGREKQLKKAVALVLTVAIVTTGIDTTAFAADATSGEEEPYVVEELVEERTKNSTTYLLSNGTKMTEYYTTDVRYSDESGELTDYDGSLVTSYEENYAYENAAGDMKHYFPEKLSEDTPVVMTKDGYEISFAPVLDDSVEDMVIDGSLEYVNIQFRGRKYKGND